MRKQFTDLNLATGHLDLESVARVSKDVTCFYVVRFPNPLLQVSWETFVALMLMYLVMILMVITISILGWFLLDDI